MLGAYDWCDTRKVPCACVYDMCLGVLSELLYVRLSFMVCPPSLVFPAHSQALCRLLTTPPAWHWAEHFLSDWMILA